MKFLKNQLQNSMVEAFMTGIMLGITMIGFFFILIAIGG